MKKYEKYEKLMFSLKKKNYCIEIHDVTGHSVYNLQ